ncbi:hypothetical protein ACEQ8H_001767 [Pleosporales sp. CAS-2024a]
MAANPPQLFLLADHIKLSLLERQRAVSLHLPSGSQDAQIARSIEQLRSGIESLESQVADMADEHVTPPLPSLAPPLHRHNSHALPPLSSISSQLPRLRAQLADLTSQFSPNTSSRHPSQSAPKAVRFTDNDASDHAARAQLFPYRDDPDPEAAAPDHSHLDNQQIHAYHSQVLRDQDDQLDLLGASIGRQRQLSEQIGQELEGQVLLLDDVEEGIDRHQAQFVRARGRLDRLSRKAKDNWSLTVIVVLIIILLLLIVITK